MIGLRKTLQKLVYLYLWLSLSIGKLLCELLILATPLFKKKPKKDFLFLPYTHKDNSGTRTRVQEYLPLLERDGFTFDVHYICDAEYYNWVYYQPKKSLIREYLFYQKMFWNRLVWCFKASNYKTVFFQRALFPDFYNQTGNPLERLLRAYNNHIIVDYFDADYARNPKLINGVVKYCDTVTVVNDFLKSYFEKKGKQVLLNDLSIDTRRYQQKKDFNLHTPVRIFWTGSIPNLSHLVELLPALRQVHRKYPIKLVIVGRSKGNISDDFVEHHLWSDETFNALITGSDLAVYPAFHADDYSQGKVAYKCLEYATCKVPMVASPYGLSSRLENEKDVLTATTEEQWVSAIIRLIENQNLREQLAENAYIKVLKYHDTQATYKNFVSILTAEQK